MAATGGSAISAGADFLADERAVSHLRSRLPSGQDGRFPYFEALLRTSSRSALPRDVTRVVCRAPRT
jgi:hypothetical protein